MKRSLLTLNTAHRSKVMQLIMFSLLSHVYLGKWASCLCSCLCLCLCVSDTNSLSSGEVEAIVISCSVILVGIVIVAIILSACGFMFKRKQLQSVTTISSVHTSRADAQQQTSMSHHAQNDEVNTCNYLQSIIEWLHVCYICTCTLFWYYVHNAGLGLYSVYHGLWQGCHCCSKHMIWKL